jgi:hypothetical protein
MYEAVSLYKGHRIIASKGTEGTNFTVLQLVIYCLFGILAGVVGGLLGLGGGFIMGPLFWSSESLLRLACFVLLHSSV